MGGWPDGLRCPDNLDHRPGHLESSRPWDRRVALGQLAAKPQRNAECHSSIPDPHLPQDL